jgi:hypothetical protein
MKAVKLYRNEKRCVTLEGDLCCGNIVSGVLMALGNIIYNVNSLRFVLYLSVA